MEEWRLVLEWIRILLEIANTTMNTIFGYLRIFYMQLKKDEMRYNLLICTWKIFSLEIKYAHTHTPHIPMLNIAWAVCRGQSHTKNR